MPDPSTRHLIADARLELNGLNVNLTIMNTGDKVYYLYTDKNGTPIKFAAVVLGLEAEGISIRVGRYDVHTNEIKTFNSIVNESSLQPRSVPCSYEDELTTS